MVKKRFLLAILLVVIAILTASEVFAGCCQGIVGCSRAFFSSECSDLATFDSKECEDIRECDVVACCHDIPGVPKATYRSTCMGMTPPPIYHYIKAFTTNPAAESAYAASLCAGALPPCVNVNCESANPPDCMCGSTSTSTGNPFCCSRDNSVFPSFGACTASPSCRAADFFNIHGIVISPEGFPIEGAEVRAGGKQTLTDEYGNFTIELLPDLSSGTVQAIKNSAINSTPYTISGADVFGLRIILNVVAGPPVGIEICEDSNKDDDGDQFGWDSGAEGLGDAADRCDPDCAGTFGFSLSRTVTKTYYVLPENGEYYEDAYGIHDFCSDRFDNDCDGFEDCEDLRCAESPSCMATECGDGVIQFPNGEGVYEQCDMDYDTMVGNDSLCPTKCVPAGEPKECTCMYEAVCGNGIIDEPLEDCDGMFDAARDRWDTSRYNTGSDCTIGLCGKPASIRPCQCPPPQICGNGVTEEPEQCDLGFLIDPETGAAYGEASGNCDGCNPDCTCPPEAARCGNNIIEYGEDCDGVLNLAGDAWDEFKTRKYGCSPDSCAVPQPDAWADEFYADYLSETIGVDTFCKCPTRCREEPPGPVLLPVKPVRFERKILLNWTDECFDDNARAYNVFRCKATGPGGEGCLPDEGGVFTIINEAPLGLVDKFVDTSFEGSEFEDTKYYCYQIEGIYGDTVSPSGVQRSEFMPEMHCIRAGMEQCFNFKTYYPFAEEFCSGYNFNVRSTCDENNTIIMVDDPGEKVNCNDGEEDFGGFTEYVCVGPYMPGTRDEGKTKCVAKSVCDYCNDPFGLF
ncbi:carboxypeptidase-like regulatory domain-containing protein, partial [Candidatus Woesearchaeota archaeon]|nr:carboxypeptidase-like regulatory domain-containing protein [Candidatus Woesearchaeota archaeon]